MIVIELAELLIEWWFALSTNPSRVDQSNTSRLGYIVWGGIEAAGQIKFPRTGVGVYDEVKFGSASCDILRVFF